MIDEIERSQNTCQEEHCQSQYDIPHIGKRIQPMPTIRPMADHGHHRVRHVALVYTECRTRKERGNGTAQQHRANHTVHHQKDPVCLLAQQVSGFTLKLVADCLQYITEQDNHPKPVGSAETGAIEQWK